MCYSGTLRGSQPCEIASSSPDRIFTNPFDCRVKPLASTHHWFPYSFSGDGFEPCSSLHRSHCIDISLDDQSGLRGTFKVSTSFTIKSDVLRGGDKLSGCRASIRTSSSRHCIPTAADSTTFMVLNRRSTGLKLNANECSR